MAIRIRSGSEYWRRSESMPDPPSCKSSSGKSRRILSVVAVDSAN